MHIDGIHELNSVDGFCIKLVPSVNENNIVIYNYDDLKKYVIRINNNFFINL